MTGAKLKYKFIIVIAIVLFTSAKLFFCESGFSERNGLPFNAYYVSEALTHLLLALVIYLSFKKGWLTALLLILAFCNFLDELVFNPLEFELRDIGLVATFLIGWYAHYKIKEYEYYCD